MPNQWSSHYPYTDAELYDLYVTKGMSQREIADLYGLAQPSVSRHMKRVGIPTRSATPRNQRGERNANWRGGRVLQARKPANANYPSGGYWYVHAPGHPNATRSGYVAEHIKVATDAAGVAGIAKNEVVHHIDLDKANNSPENLIIADRVTHANWHVQLQRIAASLMRRGMVGFDGEAGYFLK